MLKLVVGAVGVVDPGSPALVGVPLIFHILVLGVKLLGML